MESQLWKLPNSIFAREIGLKPQIPKCFHDLHCQTLKTLKTASFLSMPINRHLDLEYESVPIYSLETAGDRLIASDENGRVHVIHRWFRNDFDPLSLRPVYTTSTRLSEKSAVYSVKYMHEKLFAGTGSGHLCILDARTLDLIRMYGCHDKSIKKVESFNGDMIVTCSRDNTINVHDLRIKSLNPVNKINEAHSVISRDTPVSARGRRSKTVDGTSSSPSSSVTDVVFKDEFNIISSGAADGFLKQWDLRVTYKHMKKYHPVDMLEYPVKSNSKGFGTLKVFNSKLYASSVQHEIFQFDLTSMKYETTYTSPSQLSYYSKLDVSRNGQYLATGSEVQQVHIFMTLPSPLINQKTNNPIYSLVHEGDSDLSVCCPVFSPLDDLMLTTGGDSSIVTKWVPGIYLDQYSSKKEHIREENGSIPPQPLKTEFKYISRKRDDIIRMINLSSKASCQNDLSKGVRLDSFPNYVIDGMRLPHVAPRIKIKLRKRSVCPNDWLKSPESSSARKKSTEETTPKSRSTRKRRRFSDDALSPKIFNFFKLTSTPHAVITE